MINAQKSRGAKNMRLLCLSLLICAKAFVPPSIRTFPPTSREVLGQQRRNVECLEKEKSQHRRLQQEGKFWRATQEDAQSDDNPVILGVIVCDHGSRRKQANDMLLEVAERYRTYAGFDVVEAAHMEMAEPTIEQAFDRCVAAGAKRIVLHPFFLSPGRHVTSDIPELMQAAGRRHPDVPWLISEPLGLQELMPRVMHAAVQESVASGMWHRGDGGVDD